MRRRVIVTVVAVVTLAAFACEFIPLRVLVWDGYFDLAVSVECPGGRPRGVACEAFGRRETADAAVAELPIEARSWAAFADPFGGQPLTARVSVSGRESPFGRELRRSQFRFLAIVALLPDGRRVGKVAEIPDGRMSREVTVTIP